MDNSLFSKYQKVIKADGDKKEIIIELIEKTSGIILTKEEISLKKKEISLFISSAKKSKLHQSEIKKILNEAGYFLNY
ncbi:MAG: hypothetical protein NTW35_02015 [Candidatus Nomurabacteria bacterium]|nr:hypothetical protein [Candidatus Nomurabacteria bacterium]